MFFRTPFELFEQFDSSEIVFNPSIAVPQKRKPKLNKKSLFTSQFVSNLKCSQLNNILSSKTNRDDKSYNEGVNTMVFDFYKEIKNYNSNKNNDNI